MANETLGAVINFPLRELATIPSVSGLDSVIMESDEVGSLCPVTGQPDFYTVRIEFVPNALCIESKSLKLYLWHFRDRGIFAEHLAVEICDEVVKTICPESCCVTIKQKSRGGITIEAKSTWEKPE